MFISDEDNALVGRRINEAPNLKRSLQLFADQAMLKGPWSITYDIASTSRGDRHEYYSEGPYWWPDDEDPEGPYIKKDGHFNPEHFSVHKMALREMCKSVLILAGAGYHLKNDTYMDYAVHLIKVWFIDASTAMRPHLKYAQSIPGICEGRGIGLIDTIYFVELLQGVSYIEMVGNHTGIIDLLKVWFTEYLSWICTSTNGLEEQLNGNNHATWWTLQVMCYAHFVGNKERVQKSTDWYKEVILAEQMAEDGSFPQELGRTRSFHYSMFNLIPMALICELAWMVKEDLWHYKTHDGKGLALALDYMQPYLEQPSLWEYPSLDQPEVENSVLLILAAKRMKSKGYKSLVSLHNQDVVLQNQSMTKMMLPLMLWVSEWNAGD